MATNEPRDHHYVPQFFLRNFAVDEAKTRISTVGKHGPMGVWANAIESLCYERDFHAHLRAGISVPVETDINPQKGRPLQRIAAFRRPGYEAAQRIWRHRLGEETSDLKSQGR